MTGIAASMCGAKQRHDSRRKARAHVQHLVRAGQPRAALAVYLCWFCDCWHVGHNPAGKRVRSGDAT